MANDKNQAAMLKFAQEAQDFAKDNLYQRDVTIELFSQDKRGTFFGTLQMPSKQDFALKLVEEGLAQVSQSGIEKRMPANMMQLQDAEVAAKKQQLGIWDPKVKLVQKSNYEPKFKPQEQIVVEVTHVEDAALFYSRLVTKENAVIDQAMNGFQADKMAELEKPILKGTVCAARFSADKKWYRCKVLGSKGVGAIEVQFIDFGNCETIKTESADLKRLPSNLLSFEPQAFASSLAYVRAPRKDKTCGDEALKYTNKHIANKTHDAVVAEELPGGHLKLVLLE